MLDASGRTLPEALVATTVLALMLAVSLPAAGRLAASAAAAAATRELVLLCHGLRWRSLAEHRSHGLLFEREAGGWRWLEVRDGNGNGLRTAEVRRGIDPTISGPHRLGDRVRGARLGFPALAGIPEVPPGSGRLRPLDDPIRLGTTDLLVFGPLGTSSSGTLFVSDGRRELYAIVVYGATGRIRVWRYRPERGRWTLS